MSSIAIALKKLKTIEPEDREWVDDIIQSNRYGHTVFRYPEHLKSFVYDINKLTARQTKTRERKLREVVTRLVNKKRIPQELYESIMEKT